MVITFFNACGIEIDNMPITSTASFLDMLSAIENSAPANAVRFEIESDGVVIHSAAI